MDCMIEILTSHELVNQITHLDDLVSQADLIIFGEGVKEEDHLLETTTLTIAELAQKHDKPAIAICATDDKFDVFDQYHVTQCLILSLRCQKDTQTLKWVYKSDTLLFKHLDY